MLPPLFAVGLVAIVLGLVLRRLQLPALLGYLLAGVLLGPHVLEVVPGDVDLSRFGGLGVVLLLFFVGMEMHPERLLGHWRIALVGTALATIGGGGWSAV